MLERTLAFGDGSATFTLKDGASVQRYAWKTGDDGVTVTKGDAVTFASAQDFKVIAGEEFRYWLQKVHELYGVSKGADTTSYVEFTNEASTVKLRYGTSAATGAVEQGEGGYTLTVGEGLVDTVVSIHTWLRGIREALAWLDRGCKPPRSEGG